MIKLESSIIHPDSHLEKIVLSLLGKASKGTCGHRTLLFELSELKAKYMFAEITSESTSISWVGSSNCNYCAASRPMCAS